MFLKSKKGQGSFYHWTDIILIPIFLFLIAIVMLFAAKIWNTVQDETVLFDVNEYDDNISKEAIATISVSVNTVINMYSYIFIMLVAAMLVSMVLTGYYVESSLVFLVPGSIILMIAIMFAVPLENAYEEVVGMTEFAVESAGQTIILQIMQNMAIVVLIIGLAFMLVMYGKKTVGRAY